MIQALGKHRDGSLRLTGQPAPGSEEALSLSVIWMAPKEHNVDDS